MYSEQIGQQQERHYAATAEFQQLGCDDHLDAGVMGNINAPAVTQ